MTQEDFNYTKEWVEKSTGLTFYDDQVRFDEDGCYFDRYISSNRRVTLCINNDHSAEIWMHFSNDSAIEIYTSDWRNNHICLSIFAHIVHYN